MDHRNAARVFLEALARGEAREDLLDAMVDAVLGDERVQLALEVRAGGEHRWRRAIELAGLVGRTMHLVAVDEPGTVVAEDGAPPAPGETANHRRS